VTALCRIACTRCGRVGAYRRETLAALFGDMALPDVLIALAVCEHEGNYIAPCGVGYVEPLGAMALRSRRDQRTSSA
jgi:hypothetical protein